MSQNITFNGTGYVIPDLGELNWGQNLTDFFVAIPAGSLQKTGGGFTLSADVDFGASFGLIAPYFKSKSANIAQSGVLRLATGDAVAFRNAGNSADLLLAINGSNQLTFNGVILESDTLPSGDMFVGDSGNSSTARTISGAWTMSNVGVATISNDYITNIMINSAAAIAMTKLAALTVSKSLVSDGSGVISTGWGYTGGDMTTTANGALRFQDAAGGDYVGLAAPASVTTHTYLLPSAAGLAGQVLSWQTGGQLQWINAAGGGTINSGTTGRFAYYTGATTLSDASALVTDGSTYVAFPAGSETNPGLAVQGNLGTGLYLIGANILGVSTNGVHRWNFNSIGDFVVAASSTSQILASGGSAAAPSYSFNVSGQTDTGIYSYGADAIGFSTGGSYRAIIDTRLKLHIVGVASNTPILGILDNAGSEVWTLNYTDSDGELKIAPSSAAYPLRLTSNQVKFEAGSAAVPSITFASDTNSGLFNAGTADYIGFVTGGVVQFELENAWTTSYNPILHPDGTVGSPSISFSSATNMGMYATTVPDIRWAVAGALKMSLDATALQMTVPIGAANGSVSVPSLSFAADPDTGFYSFAANRFGCSCNAERIFYVFDNGTDSGLIMEGTLRNPRIYIANGNVTLPGICFNSDTNTGIYGASNDCIYFTCAGTQRFSIEPTGTYHTVDLLFNNPGTWNIGNATYYPGRIFVGPGTTGSPSYTFQGDTDCGLFMNSTNNPGIVAGGTVAATFGATGNTAGTTYTPLATLGGGTALFQHAQYTSVSTSTTVIITTGSTCNFALVAGFLSSGNQFMDVVMWTYYNGTPLVLGSRVDGTVAARTYTSNLSTLRLAMASGTYNIYCKTFDLM